MTLLEASQRYNISIDKLRYYARNGLLSASPLPDGSADYAPGELRRAGLIHSLLQAGMDAADVRKYLLLLEQPACNQTERISTLQKERNRLLCEIHDKQRSLDEIDYMICETKQEGNDYK